MHSLLCQCQSITVKIIPCFFHLMFSLQCAVLLEMGPLCRLRAPKVSESGCLGIERLTLTTSVCPWWNWRPASQFLDVTSLSLLHCSWVMCTVTKSLFNVGRCGALRNLSGAGTPQQIDCPHASCPDRRPHLPQISLRHLWLETLSML